MVLQPVAQSLCRLSCSGSQFAKTSRILSVIQGSKLKNLLFSHNSCESHFFFFFGLSTSKIRHFKRFRFRKTYNQHPKTRPPWPTSMYSPIYYFVRLTAHTMYLSVSSRHIEIRTLDISNREQDCQTVPYGNRYVLIRV